MKEIFSKAVEVLLAMFEERAILRKDEEEQKVSETWQETISQAEKETMACQRLLQDNIAGQDTRRSIPYRTGETIPVAWADTSTTVPLRSQGWETLCRMRGGTLCQRMNHSGWFSERIRSHYQQTSQTTDPRTVIPHTEKKANGNSSMTYVTRFKNWLPSFRREVIRGSTHPRSVTDWLAEIGQPKTNPRCGELRICIRPAPRSVLKHLLQKIRKAS